MRTEISLAYEGLNIGLVTDRDGDIQWVQEFLCPWFDSGDGAVDVLVKVATDPSLYGDLLSLGPTGEMMKVFMMDANIIEFPAWRVPAGQLAVFDERHKLFYVLNDGVIQLVYRDRITNGRVQIMRVFRELAMGAAQMTGARLLHASAFTLGGRAVIIAGPRNAGKTSMLCYMLANAPAGFLSNDRLLVRPAEQGISSRGMPTIVSLREGTVNMIPGMRQQLERQRFRSRATLEESHSPSMDESYPAKPGRYGLTPAQFCSLLNCDSARAGQGGLLLFPRQTGQPGGLELSPLEEGRTRDKLRHCLFGQIAPDRLSQVFSLAPPGGGERAAISDDRLCALLASHLPAYECHLGQDSYTSDDGARRILELHASLERSLGSGAAQC